MTVKQLEENLSYRELIHWIAFFQLFPFGEDANDIRTALLCSVVANASPNRKKGRTFKPKNFLPFQRQHRPRPRSKETLIAHIKAAFGIKEE
jgi:hypothetical protein